MADVLYRDPDLEWLDHVQPVGLVVAPSVLKELGLTPLHQWSKKVVVMGCPPETSFRPLAGARCVCRSGRSTGPSRLPVRQTTAHPASRAGHWAGWDLNVALWTDGAWLRLPPRIGWRAWVEDEALLLVYDGAGWIGITPDVLQNMALLGLGTTADPSNPFSAKLNAALWTAKTVAGHVRTL